MLINLRNALMAGKRTPTAKDYVQSGLVFQLDGIENAGYGVHTDLISDGWKDLTGRAPNVDITSNEVAWSSNALVRVGTGGKTVAYPNIDLTDPLSERTFEYVISAVGLPAKPTTTYYFSNMNSNGGNNRILWKMPGPKLYNTLRSGAGDFQSHADATTLTQATTITMVGTGEYYSADRNWARYYTNGEYVTSSAFGGNPITSPSLSMFQDVRLWPESNTIRFHAIRLYSRALTADEIARNYAIDKARFNLP